MKRKLVLVGVFLILGLSACRPTWSTSSEPESSSSPTNQNPSAFSSLEDHQLVEMMLGNQPLRVEVVTKTESITQGLSDRNEIGADGMLFLLPQTKVHTFWMKDMKFALDMVWLKDWQVVDMSFNVPPPAPGTPVSELPLTSPKVPANMVLEIPAGKALEWGLSLGDQLVPLPGK